MKVLFLAILIWIHPVHVSLTGIDYDSEKRSYKVFVKVYSDDLETDMKLGYYGSEAVGETSVEYGEYLRDRLAILEDGRRVDMVMKTMENDDLEHRFTLEATGHKRVKEITVINRIMTGLYTDQSNMVLFRMNDFEDGVKLTTSDTLRSFRLK